MIDGLALCAGVAGLELGVGLVLPHRTVGYVERDAYAAACLVARMEEQTLAPAPIWDDLATFDCGPWRGCVDLITAGFPCQPFSVAGKQLGLDDERWLWPHVYRVVREVGPDLIFMENVPLLSKRGLPLVLGDLAQAGFNAEWSCLAAREVGATHKRERIWILAYRDRERLAQLWSSRVFDREWEAYGDDVDGRGGEAVGNTETRGGTTRVRPDSRSTQWGIAEWPGGGLRLFPPKPDDTLGWGEWIDAGGPQPSIRRDADGLAARMDRLRVIGNGVVPLVAAVAFRGLVERALGVSHG